MMRTALLKTLPALALACALGACGGGGSDSDSAGPGGGGSGGGGGQATTYTVTPSVSGGTISPSGPVSVQSGGSVTFTLTPDPGGSLTGLSVSNTCGGGTLSGSTYRVNSVNADCTVTVTFNPPAPTASITACFTATETVNFAMKTSNPQSGYEYPNLSTVGPMTYRGLANTGQTYTYPSGTKSTDYWMVTNSGVTLVAEETVTVVNGLPRGVTTTLINLTLPQNMTPGQTVGNASLVGFETVKLAGKTFANTCHVRIGNDEGWYAPGYGAVKQIVSGVTMQYNGDR